MAPVTQISRSTADYEDHHTCWPLENSRLPLAKTRVSVTGWRSGFHSKREFSSFYNTSSELQPFIFAEQFSHCKYHSTCDFPLSAKQRRSIHTPTAVPSYTSTRRILKDSLNTFRWIQPCIRNCLHSHLARQSWKPSYPHRLSGSPSDHYKCTSNASYKKESETASMEIATSGIAYISISGLQQLLHWSSCSLSHDASCICSGQTPGPRHVEQTAVHECMRLGDVKLHNPMHCQCISWSPTLVNNRHVLEHSNAAKYHHVNPICGRRKADNESGMLKPRPTFNITLSHWYLVWSQVDKPESHLIQSVRENKAELCNLHCLKSDAEHFELIDCLLEDNKYHFPVAQLVEDGVLCPNRMHRQLKAANEWPSSIFLPGGINSEVYLYQISKYGK